MAGVIDTLDEEKMGQDPSDPWAVAFASLDKKDEEDAQTDVGGDVEVPSGDDTAEPDGSGGSVEDEAGDGDGVADMPGGPGDLGGADGGEDADLDWLGIDVTEDEIERQRQAFVDEVKERTINDVAREYIKQGARHTNGRLGATINDPDVCKRDRDGVPRFYNPETGREFTGDNPRRQAQEWVDDYNRELADAFNKTCADYSKKLMERDGGRIAIIEFAPKYKQLDPVRRSMFEAMIEDYEITDDDGNIIGYSCDLDRALSAVNRQVQAIHKRYGNRRFEMQKKKEEPSGPALDTPSTNGGAQGNGRPNFKSIEEAMEWEQDQILAKMKKGSR